MVDVIQHLKTRARILHRSASEGNPLALRRVFGSVATLGIEDEKSLAETVKRRQCLSAVAKELGFKGWAHLTHVLNGKDKDFGTAFCPPRMSAFWNVWCKTYEEASKIRNETSGYLLAFNTQFLVVDRHYIEALGLDPDDPDWAAIGRDWVKPGNIATRNRLYGKLFVASTEGSEEIKGDRS